jgi:hypothetical protein
MSVIAPPKTVRISIIEGLAGNIKPLLPGWRKRKRLLRRDLRRRFENGRPGPSRRGCDKFKQQSRNGPSLPLGMPH